LVNSSSIARVKIKSNIIYIIEYYSKFLFFQILWYNNETLVILELKEYSSAGRASVSKTEGRKFDPCCSWREDMRKVIDFIRYKLMGELKSLELPERKEFLLTLFTVCAATLVLSLFFSFCKYIITSFFKLIKIV
jgi:hypothetical protein